VRAIPSGAAKPAVPTHSDASSRREWILTAALSLLLLLFGGTAASAVWSRRRPFEPLDLVEVELQQMIAEERLRQTLPGAPVRAGTSASAERPLDASEQQYEIVAAGDDDVN